MKRKSCRKAAHLGCREILNCLRCSHCHCTLFSLKKRGIINETEAEHVNNSEWYHEESLLPLLARP